MAGGRTFDGKSGCYFKGLITEMKILRLEDKWNIFKMYNIILLCSLTLLFLEETFVMEKLQ